MKSDLLVADSRRRFLQTLAATGALLSDLSVQNAFAASSKPEFGHTLVAAIPYNPRFFPINYDYDPMAYFIAGSLYNRLIAYDFFENLIPGLAERWEVSKDGLAYTFHLAQNVKWHDGHPFTADDVVFTVQSIVANKGVVAKSLSSIKNIDAVDSHTVRMTLNAPNASFLDQLANYYGFVILPKHIYSQGDVRANPANLRPVGTGPFTFESFETGSAVNLVANKDYFRGRPYLDRLVFKVITSRPVAMGAVQTGQAGLSLVAAAFGDIPHLRSLPGVEVTLPAWTRPQTISFNMRKAPYNDQRVRQAFGHAIDRKQISDQVFSGLAVPAEGVYVPTTVWFYDGKAKQPDYNKARAEALFEEAGLKRGPDGIRLKARYAGFIAQTFGSREVGEVLKQQLRDVGVNLDIEMREFALFKDVIIQQHDFDLTWSSGETGPDPNVFYNYVGTDGFRNVMGYHNAHIDQLFDQGLATLDRGARKRIYFEIQEIVARELPELQLVVYADPFAYRREFSGFPWEAESRGKVARDDYSKVWWRGTS